MGICAVCGIENPTNKVAYLGGSPYFVCGPSCEEKLPAMDCHCLLCGETLDPYGKGVVNTSFGVFCGQECYDEWHMGMGEEIRTNNGSVETVLHYREGGYFEPYRLEAKGFPHHSEESPSFVHVGATLVNKTPRRRAEFQSISLFIGIDDARVLLDNLARAIVAAS